MTEREFALYDEVMCEAVRCIKLVRDGEPLIDAGHPAADRKANAQALLALAQTAKTLEGGRRL